MGKELNSENTAYMWPLNSNWKRLLVILAPL